MSKRKREDSSTKEVEKLYGDLERKVFRDLETKEEQLRAEFRAAQDQVDSKLKSTVKSVEMIRSVHCQRATKANESIHQKLGQLKNLVQRIDTSMAKLKSVDSGKMLQSTASKQMQLLRRQLEDQLDTASVQRH